MEENYSGVSVVVVPLPAQGHLNQLLHLTRIISTRGIPAHYIGSTTHNRQVKDRANGWDPSTVPNLHFHDFQLPEFITPPRDHLIARPPPHLLPLFDAFNTSLREPLLALLHSLSSTYRRVVVVYDNLMGVAAEMASLVPNAECYCFFAVSVFALFYLQWEAFGKPIDEQGEDLVPHDIPRVRFEDSFPEEIANFAAPNVKWIEQFSDGYIYNTCDAIEGPFVDIFIRYKCDITHWALGPFNPVKFDSTGGPGHKCLEWLDKQPPNSVLYISFGTATSVSDDQIAEIAIALERSEQRFIWVLRGADKGDIYNEEVRKAQLPDGFEERIKEVGMIVRDWAPQLQILAHSSTGGFLSHCGWNSCMESLSMGKPIVAWPMHSDQPRNAFYVTEVLKVGVTVRDWARRKELISSDTIETSIRKLMVSEESNMMRKRAIELGMAIRGAVSEGGSSSIKLESFLAHISR